MPKIKPADYLEQQQQQQRQIRPNTTTTNTATSTINTNTARKRGSGTDRRRMPAMARLTNGILLSCIASAASAVSDIIASSESEELPEKVSPRYPSLTLVEQSLLTTAKLDFGGHDDTFQAASRWNGEKLQASQDDELRAPHLACAEYGHGREAASRLKAFLSPGAVRSVYHSSEHGACFLATASNSQAAAMSAEPARFELTSVGAFPSVLKIAPGLLDHGDSSSSIRETSSAEGSDKSGRLSTSHGSMMRIDDIQGLSIQLSPGTLPARSLEADAFIGGLLQGLMSESVDLHAGNFWSDPAMSEGEHLARPEGALRGREWSRAAAVVHELSEAAGTTPGDVCSWGDLVVHHAANDALLVSGLDHLLYGGRGAGGQREEAVELHVACFMGLVSMLAGRMEVLRVSPWQKKVTLNAAARANIQSGTVTATPLTDAGLDGTGEIIQVLDSGLDETSCYFEDGDGLEVTHGYYFDEIGVVRETPSQTTSFATYSIFDGGDFFIDTTRRKVVQYINMVKPDSTSGSSASTFTTPEGDQGYWVPADSFSEDERAGHGTHTAGSAAGSTLNSPAETVSCVGTDVLSCAGGCIDGMSLTDDLLSYYDQITSTVDIDRICPEFGCDATVFEQCLSDDVAQTLTDNGGMAQGAKLSIFDVFYQEYGLSYLAGNGLWEPCMEAGCKLHSNSYGNDMLCSSSPTDVEYDDFMYNNPENLLIFAAGNDGDVNDGRSVCTISSPAITKNVLAVGATSSGESRITLTAADGTAFDGTNGFADIDTVASFSSYGPTLDNRIKPEIVAPGDMIYSAASDGTGERSCRLYAYLGTSMSCPIVAGASAMIRQYFVDSSFYAADVTARGFCDQGFPCEGFSPSSATVKAMLINSANLMGGSSEPDGFRGFGRVHLEQGIPLDGEGSMALFVADAANTSIPELMQHEYLFDVDSDAGLDFRVTLSWIDPAATALSTKQLVHDLDLTVSSPSGTRYTMWDSGDADKDNVNERVIVDAADVESGTWAVWVWAQALTTDFQSYSLVVNGAISPGTGDGTSAGSTGPVKFWSALFWSIASTLAIAAALHE